MLPIGLTRGPPATIACLPAQSSIIVSPRSGTAGQAPGRSKGGTPMAQHPSRQTQGSEPGPSDPARSAGVVEEVEVRGHIVDSLLLPKILDRILLMGGTFEIRECKIGVRRSDPSYARIAIRADSHETLDAILGDVAEHGASPLHPEDAVIIPADIP